MDPTERFTQRVEEYARCRPGYPGALLELLRGELGLAPEHVVADLGSGTGILTRLFLEHGNTVYGVEPNAAMRRAAEVELAGFGDFHSVAGRAEETQLEDDAADLVVAGQAFHWFDVVAARREVRRILRPSGWVVLVWNHRRTVGTLFLESYEIFLERWCPEYGDVRARYENEAELRTFFAPHGYQVRTLHNSQEFDREGLRGRLLSSSYAQGPESAQHAPMLAALDDLFLEHAAGGRVRFEYDTTVYYGSAREGR
jgi:SAM-dependent methyltransferase